MLFGLEIKYLLHLVCNVLIVNITQMILLYYYSYPSISLVTVVIQCLGQLGYTKKITHPMKKLRNGKLTNRINKFILFPKGDDEGFAKRIVGFNSRLSECGKALPEMLTVSSCNSAKLERRQMKMKYLQTTENTSMGHWL